MNKPTVSVIVTTVSRPEVRQAVLSALRQTRPPLEVIVVVDRPGEAVPPALRDLPLPGREGNEEGPTVSVVFSGGVGGSAARMRGVAEARGDVIAFLDDDDRWQPGKLERQLALWPARGPGGDDGRHTLVSCRLAMVSPDGKQQRELPIRLIAPGERVADYLFRRTRVRYGEGMLHTSTLICDRGLLAVQPWDNSLRLHEDWDWTIAVGGRGDTDIVMCPDILVTVSAGNRRSVSMSADWQVSMAWVRQRARSLTPREIGDFLLTHTAPLAIRGGDYRAAWAIAGHARRQGRPGLAAWGSWSLHLAWGVLNAAR